MATNTLPKSDAVFIEAPASWNVRYCTTEGFCCQLTLRADNGKDLLQKADIALSYLLQHDYKPEENHRQPRSNDTKSTASSGKWCALHDCELKRFEKDGRVWFSHKAPDGSWCRGKQKEN